MPTGPKGQKRPADVIGAAVRVIRIATGEGRRRLGRANGGYSYLARSPAHPAERFPIIPDSRTHDLPPGVRIRERGGSVRGSLCRTDDRGRAPRRCRCVSRFRFSPPRHRLLAQDEPQTAQTHPRAREVDRRGANRTVARLLSRAASRRRCGSTPLGIRASCPPSRATVGEYLLTSAGGERSTGDCPSAHCPQREPARSCRRSRSR